MTLAQILSSFGTLAAVLLFIPTALLLGISATRTQERTIAERGRTIANMLALSAVDSMLNEDDLALHSHLQQVMERDHDVKYAFITGRHGAVVTHTFEGGVPADLLRIGGGVANTGTEVVRFRTDDGTMLHVSAPIFEGMLGYVQAGMDRSGAFSYARRIAALMSIGFVLAIAVILTGAKTVAALISEPVMKLEQAVSGYPERVTEPHVNPQGGTAEVASLAQSISGMIHRINELEKERITAQKRLIRADRLAAVGEMAAGIVHEVRNPLDGMQECIRYLQKDNEKSKRAEKFCPMIRDGLERIDRVMSNLLETARSQPEMDVRACSIREALDSIRLMLQTHLQGKNVRLIWSGSDLCRCICDPDALIQAAVNLALNGAEEASNAPDPIVGIESGCDEDNAYVRVNDSGPGVSEDAHDRLFAPFFTTKPRGRGTGLGLSVSRRLIRDCGGDIELSREPGKFGGAEFTIKLRKA